MRFDVMRCSNVVDCRYDYKINKHPSHPDFDFELSVHSQADCTVLRVVGGGAKKKNRIEWNGMEWNGVLSLLYVAAVSGEASQRKW